MKQDIETIVEKKDKILIILTRSPAEKSTALKEILIEGLEFLFESLDLQARLMN